VTTVTEQELITQAVLDYYEGWYDGDPVRMERALHRDLVKRRAGDELGITTAERMIELTRQGAGREDGADRTLKIEVEDVHGDIASVTVQAAVYYEYLQLVRTDDGWKIANVLYEVR
jgi:alkyl sulfatase BDS1-like metallo-beta-lactamase superfamily hydrolase